MTFMFPGTYPPMPIVGLWGYSTKGKTKIVELESVSVLVNIRGFVAQVNAKLLYHNSSSKPLQVRYTLPVDESAAVYKFEAHLDGRTIVAHCMEKKKAEKVYKEAVDAGKTAILTRQDERLSDMLQLDLGNLPKGSKATLSISLVMELKVQTDGGVSFVLPTVLNPRYCPAGGQTDPRGFDTEFEQEKAVTVTKAYTIDIKAGVSGGHEIARIISHTDSLNVTISEDLKSAEVTQDGGFKSDHDWSLLLYYANPYKTRVIRETGDRSATGLMKDDLVMINLFPEVPANSYSSKNEVIFLIDRSGSMQGDKIQSARATLLLFLKSLPMGCLFNVISFGSDFTALFPKSCEYNENTLKEACKLQETMDADMGGTEILRPFQNIYSTAPTPGYARQILLISDGEVYNVDQVTRLVGRHAHESRVFAVGIGYGASTALIRGVARAGRGRSEMVVQQDKLQLKVMGLVSSMVQDNVQNVRVACEMEPTSSVKLVPKVPPIIFGGQHLTLYARVPSTSTVKALSIMGNIGDADLNISVKDSDIVSVHDGEMSLHRLAARAQINQWQLDDEEDVAEDMIALSITSGVVSKLTALVGVDQDGKTVVHKRREDSPEESLQRTYGNVPLGRGRVYKASRGSHSSHSITSERAQVRCASKKVRDQSNDGGFDVDHVKTEQSDDDLLKIVSLQNFDGSWSLKDISEHCAKSYAQLAESNPSQNEKAWATAVALALLESQFGGARAEWSLLANKARLFISNCGEDVDDLVKKAQSFLATPQ